MAKLFRIFLTGLFISFLGSLPLGTLNIAAMQIAISDGIQPAFLFSLGSLTAEVVYVRLSLMAMDWVRKQRKLFRILEWITLLIIIALAVSSFYAAVTPQVHENVILSSTLHRYFLGLIMSALNPVQIPFGLDGVPCCIPNKFYCQSQLIIIYTSAVLDWEPFLAMGYLFLVAS